MSLRDLASAARTELRVAGVLVRTNLRASAELRVSFAMQVVGMMVNNVAILAVWVLFFAASGPVNGWSSVEVIALQGFSALVYGVAFTVGAGARKLPSLVHSGAFDGLLTSPRSLALRILTTSTTPSAIGDALFGVVLLVGTLVWTRASVEQVLILLLAILPGVALFSTVALTCSLSAFLVPEGEDVGDSLFAFFMNPAIFPSGVFTGVLRTFFIFVVPAITASSLPVEAIRDASWGALSLVWLVALGWVALTQLLLTLAVRRYESGNLTGARGS